MSDINDVAKRSAAERLLKAMQLEKLGPSDAARKLNILASYVSMSKQEKYWPKMPKSAWDRILLWCNTGETLHHFKIPNGEVKKEEAKLTNWPSKDEMKPRIELPPKEIARKPAEIIKPDEKITAPLAVEKSVPLPTQEFTDTARLKVCLDIEINLVINGQKISLK